MSITIDQRIVVKFHTKLGNAVTITYNLLKQAYGNEDVSCERAFKRFQNDREDAKDDSRPDLPSTSKTVDNIEKIGNLVQSDHQ
ncbi:FLJ37770-like protein [Trichonephila clavipes]|nr:FLJ37770-like protein [Trichonephila clavipes]